MCLHRKKGNNFTPPSTPRCVTHEATGLNAFEPVTPKGCVHVCVCVRACVHCSFNAGDTRCACVQQSKTRRAVSDDELLGRSFSLLGTTVHVFLHFSFVAVRCPKAAGSRSRWQPFCDAKYHQPKVVYTSERRVVVFPLVDAPPSPRQTKHRVCVSVEVCVCLLCVVCAPCQLTSFRGPFPETDRLEPEETGAGWQQR